MTTLVIEVTVPSNTVFNEDAESFVYMIRRDLNKHGWGVELRSVEHAGQTYEYIKKGWLNNGDR